jgi:hypothetical protein
VVQVRRATVLDLVIQQVTEQVAVQQWEPALLQVQEQVQLPELQDVPELQEPERLQEQPVLEADQCQEAAQQEVAVELVQLPEADQELLLEAVAELGQAQLLEVVLELAGPEPVQELELEQEQAEAGPEVAQPQERVLVQEQEQLLEVAPAQPQVEEDNYLLQKDQKTRFIRVFYWS